MRTTTAKPADWFGPEHVPLLLAYCQHTVAAADWVARIRALAPADIVGVKGEKRLEKLRKLAQGETAFVERLARSMRLTQQSAFRAADSGGKRPGSGAPGGRKPWDE